MKQITLILHYDDDELAENMYQVLKDVYQHKENGSVASFSGRDIVRLELKGPNDSRWICNLHNAALTEQA